jgi:hypothetical protein
MALALYDRVQETGTAVTTVSFILSGAVAGFQSFSVIGNGNTTYYSATDASGNWEVGLGTYSTTGPTLTRTTIYSSSNAGSAVTFSGSVNVFVTYPAGTSVVSGNNYGTSGQVLTSGGTGVAPTWTTAGGGTVTSITAGTGLSGGTITSTGTIAIDSTVATLTGTQTLTNKSIVARVSSTTSISSPLAWTSDNFDLYAATAQAVALTINADAGTPVDGEKIQFRFTCDATPRIITFTGGVSQGFKPVGVTLTVSASNFTYTLTASKTTYFGAIYNSSSARWEIVALSQEA